MDDLPELIPGFTSFRIQSVPVSSPLILAPMDGYSDAPFRSVTRRLGSALSYTEFINALDVTGNAPNYQKRCEFSEMERPVVFQLFDEDPSRMIRAAEKLYQKWAPDIMDINMGCSVRHVTNRGAGAGLLRHPEKVAATIEGLVKTLPIPVTLKIRLGWDEQSKNYLEIGKIAQESGASAIALHARTREQLFSDAVDLDAIALLKQNLAIPVIGNGDIRTLADARRMIDYTKCDAVMIGRAAISNPWIFAGYDPSNVPNDLFRATVRDHLAKMKEFYGTERGCVIFRKYAKMYLQKRSIPADQIRPILMLNDPDRFSKSFLDLIENEKEKPIE
mgnify:CR=1 FL=1